MKYGREDYQRIQDPTGLIPEDEPVFLIRGQDTLGPEILDAYANENDKAGGSLRVSQGVREQAEEMRRWQCRVTSKFANLPEEDTSWRWRRDPVSRIYKLSDEVFNLACVHCGITTNLQAWPHRDNKGEIVGLVFACSACSNVIPGATVAITYIQEEELNEQNEGKGSQESSADPCGQEERAHLGRSRDSGVPKEERSSDISTTED